MYLNILTDSNYCRLASVANCGWARLLLVIKTCRLVFRSNTRGGAALHLPWIHYKIFNVRTKCRCLRLLFNSFRTPVPASMLLNSYRNYYGTTVNLLLLLTFHWLQVLYSSCTTRTIQPSIELFTKSTADYLVLNKRRTRTWSSSIVLKNSK